MHGLKWCAVKRGYNVLSRLPLEDLLRLPELFPFRFTVNADLLRRSGWFEVYRQGSGWDMVALQ